MVTLAPIDVARHAALLHAWRQRPDIARFMYSQRPIAWEDHLRWLASLPSDPTRRHWVIEHAGRPVGSVYFTDLDRTHARAMLGMYVAEEGARVLGVGAAAEVLALDEAFGPLGLEKVGCEVFAGNESPLRLHRRLGFQPEGLLRRHARCDGAWVDVHRLSLLRDEWAAVRGAHRHALGRLLRAPVAA